LTGWAKDTEEPLSAKRGKAWKGEYEKKHPDKDRPKQTSSESGRIREKRREDELRLEPDEIARSWRNKLDIRDKDPVIPKQPGNQDELLELDRFPMPREEKDLEKQSWFKYEWVFSGTDSEKAQKLKAIAIKHLPLPYVPLVDLMAVLGIPIIDRASEVGGWLRELDKTFASFCHDPNYYATLLRIDSEVLTKIDREQTVWARVMTLLARITQEFLPVYPRAEVPAEVATWVAQWLLAKILFYLMQLRGFLRAGAEPIPWELLNEGVEGRAEYFHGSDPILGRSEFRRVYPPMGRQQVYYYPRCINMLNLDHYGLARSRCNDEILQKEWRYMRKFDVFVWVEVNPSEQGSAVLIFEAWGLV
jgi:hypothetical protein